MGPHSRKDFETAEKTDSRKDFETAEKTDSRMELRTDSRKELATALQKAERRDFGMGPHSRKDSRRVPHLWMEPNSRTAFETAETTTRTALEMAEKTDSRTEIKKDSRMDLRTRKDFGTGSGSRSPLEPTTTKGPTTMKAPTMEKWQTPSPLFPLFQTPSPLPFFQLFQLLHQNQNQNVFQVCPFFGPSWAAKRIAHVRPARRYRDSWNCVLRPQIAAVANERRKENTNSQIRRCERQFTTANSEDRLLESRTCRTCHVVPAHEPIPGSLRQSSQR